jgi:hypothetical protein
LHNFYALSLSFIPQGATRKWIFDGFMHSTVWKNYENSKEERNWIKFNFLTAAVFSFSFSLLTNHNASLSIEKKCILFQLQDIKQLQPSSKRSSEWVSETVSEWKKHRWNTQTCNNFRSWLHSHGKCGAIADVKCIACM